MEKKYDLEERTEKFSIAVIRFSQTLPINTITKPIISQLIRASTSIGANYCEADCAESKKDFEHKIGICKKEAKEAKYWTRMIAEAVPEAKEKARQLYKEAHELSLIFITIVKNSRSKDIRN